MFAAGDDGLMAAACRGDGAIAGQAEAPTGFLLGTVARA